MKTLLLLFHKRAAGAVGGSAVLIHKTQVGAVVLVLVLLLEGGLALALPALLLPDGDGGFEGIDDDEGGGGGSDDSSEDPDSDPSSFPLPALDFLLQQQQQQTLPLPLLVKLVLFLPPL